MRERNVIEAKTEKRRRARSRNINDARFHRSCMIKALKDTPQEDNRVLSDPYNQSPYIPRIPPHLPFTANFVPPRSSPYHHRQSLETWKLKGVL